MRLIRRATYTPASASRAPIWMPDWILRAASLSLDQEEETG
jgi:LPS-assembly protein